MRRPGPLTRRHVLGGAAGLAVAQARAGSVLAEDRPKRIYMALWRGETDVERGFRDFLASSGINVDYIVRDAGQSDAALRGMVEEIRTLRPDLVYTFATQGALGIVGTHDAPDRSGFVDGPPVVFVNVGDPIGTGLVTRLDGHGRNLTGVIHLPSIEKQFDAMRAYRPVRRLAFFYSPAEAYGAAAAHRVRELAADSGIDLHIDAPMDASGRASVDEFRPALERLARVDPDFLFIPSTSAFIPHAGIITRIALELRMPTFSSIEGMIRGASGLMGLVGSFTEVGRFAGYKAMQILGGRPAAEIPIEMLSRFSLLINMDVARELRVYPPLRIVKVAQFL